MDEVNNYKTSQISSSGGSSQAAERENCLRPIAPSNFTWPWVQLNCTAKWLTSIERLKVVLAREILPLGPGLFDFLEEEHFRHT